MRLRWLLNALEEQTLPRERWEVVVGHDSAGPETEELLRTHPLAEAGVLRHVTLAPGSAPPGRNRNAAWRMSQAPIVAFTDDDCRPPPDWLANALAAAQRHPGAIVQGSTMPDPDEGKIGRLATFHRTQSIWPPRPWAQACNIVYPREVLERVGGFPEDMYVGEDTALAEVARATGDEYPLGDVKLRAPIIPKKFIHTAGNFREHEEESKRVEWSHEIAPWIVFFQNVDAIVGPDDPIVYPEHLTEELDYELELAVVVARDGKWFGAEEAADYVGGYVIFNDITARDIQRREMRTGVFSF